MPARSALEDARAKPAQSASIYNNIYIVYVQYTCDSFSFVKVPILLRISRRKVGAEAHRTPLRNP